MLFGRLDMLVYFHLLLLQPSFGLIKMFFLANLSILHYFYFLIPQIELRTFSLADKHLCHSAIWIPNLFSSFQFLLKCFSLGCETQQMGSNVEFTTEVVLRNSLGEHKG